MGPQQNVTWGHEVMDSCTYIYQPVKCMRCFSRKKICNGIQIQMQIHADTDENGKMRIEKVYQERLQRRSSELST